MKARSTMVAALLSLSLFACASQETIPSAARAGGGSGGSGFDSSAPTEKAPSHERTLSDRQIGRVEREPAMHMERAHLRDFQDHLTCRSCR
ncbi:MAG TPA: hypothetical protein VF407_22300 [Polyangiaceae bacterium]